MIATLNHITQAVAVVSIFLASKHPLGSQMAFPDKMNQVNDESSILRPFLQSM